MNETHRERGNHVVTKCSNTTFINISNQVRGLNMHEQEITPCYESGGIYLKSPLSEQNAPFRFFFFFLLFFNGKQKITEEMRKLYY